MTNSTSDQAEALAKKDADKKAKLKEDVDRFVKAVCDEILGPAEKEKTND